MNRNKVIILVMSVLLVVLSIYTVITQRNYQNQLEMERRNIDVAVKESERLLAENLSLEKQLAQEKSNIKEKSYVLTYRLMAESLPKEGWEDYFPKHYPDRKSINAIGKSTEDMEQILGTPYIKLKYINNSEELWVYMPNAMVEPEMRDNTGIYLRFENNKLVEQRIDDFNGILEEALPYYFN